MSCASGVVRLEVVSHVEEMGGRTRAGCVLRGASLRRASLVVSSAIILWSCLIEIFIFVSRPGGHDVVEYLAPGNVGGWARCLVFDAREIRRKCDGEMVGRIVGEYSVVVLGEASDKFLWVV